MKNCLIAFFVFYSVTLHAQYSGYTAVNDLDAFKTTFSSGSKKIESIKSNFVQEKNLAVLAEKITSEGKFAYKKDNRVRIEYVTPFTYLLVMNGDQILTKDNEKENKVNVKSNKLFQQINRIMVDCVQGTILDNKDFTVRVFENSPSWLLEITPLNKTMKSFFKNIIVVADKKDDSVISIDMREPSGDNTLIRFTQKEINVSISDELFKIK